MAYRITNALITKFQMVSDGTFNKFQDLTASKGVITVVGATSSGTYTPNYTIFSTSNLSFSSNTVAQIVSYFCGGGSAGSLYGGPSVRYIEKGSGNTDADKAEVGDLIKDTSSNNLITNSKTLFTETNGVIADSSSYIVETDGDGEVTSVTDFGCF